MKSYLFLFLLINSIAFSQVELEVNQTGKPDYRKLLTSSLAFQIYTKGAEKVFYLTPNNYFQLNGMTDTLEFTITGDSSNYSIQLQIEIDDLSVKLKDEILIFTSGGKTIEFDVKVQKSKKNTRYSPIMDGILTKDEDFGMVVLENRLMKYSKVELNNESFNIAILDRNKNGIVDSNDLLCLSFDKYFLTKENLKTTYLREETIIKVGESFYNIAWNSGYKLQIESLPFHDNPRLILNHSVPDIILADGNVLSNLVQHQEYTILSFWSEFSPSSIEDIPDLNQLKNVIGFHLNEEVDVENYKLNFLNYFLTQQQLDNFGANGYPYYIVVNKNLESIAVARSIKQVSEKYK